MSRWIYRRVGKRLLDVCCATLCLLLLSPVLLVVAVAVAGFFWAGQFFISKFAREWAGVVS